MENKIFKIDPAQSGIEWVGRKVTGLHEGTIDLKEGEIVLRDSKLAGGSFVADTTSIKILDIKDAATNAQMAGHLASEDFFSSQKFPYATLDIVSARGKYADGNLTIRGITHPIRFETAILSNDTVLTASAKLIVDRTKYEMKFRSGTFFQNLGDTLIYNDFELNVRVTAKLVEKTVAVEA